MKDDDSILTVSDQYSNHWMDSTGRGGGTHDNFVQGCATLWPPHRPFLEFLTKK